MPKPKLAAHGSAPLADDTVRAAWLYYAESMTQAQIARSMGISRARVIALLAAARDQGLVRIRIEAKGSAQAALETRLVERYRLREAIVVPAPSDDAAVATVVGHAAGTYVGDRVRDGMSIGVGWGATLHASLRAIGERPLRQLSVISLLGSITHSRTIVPATVARRLADAFGAECYQLTAPLIVADAAVRDALWAEPGLSELRRRARRVDMALVSVGDLSAEATLFSQSLLPRADLDSLVAAGAVGDVLCQFLDSHGTRIEHPLRHRVVAFPIDELRDLPEVVIASGGRRKTAALRAALAAIRPSVLITDETAARGLVAA
jgi:DNA-binding transcriptional regulator LsrR (DeoR family)